MASSIEPCPPCRLTRNMVAFLSMFGVDGIFVTAMVCVAQVRPAVGDAM